MKQKYMIPFILTIIIILSSCTSSIDLKDAGFEKSFRLAKKEFKNEKYLKAIEDLNVILLNYSGNKGIDSAQFLLGESHFKMEEFYSASYEYSKLYINFPLSHLCEEAMYQAAFSYYKLSPASILDQTESTNALTKFKNFLDRYKTGKFADLAKKYIKELQEKFAQKTFETGEIYLKMEEPRAAIVYFNDVIATYYDSKYFSLSFKGLADAYTQMSDEYNANLNLNKFKTLSEDK